MGPLLDVVPSDWAPWALLTKLRTTPPSEFMDKTAQFDRLTGTTEEWVTHRWDADDGRFPDSAENLSLEAFARHGYFLVHQTAQMFVFKRVQALYAYELIMGEIAARSAKGESDALRRYHANYRLACRLRKQGLTMLEHFPGFNHSSVPIART